MLKKCDLKLELFTLVSVRHFELSLFHNSNEVVLHLEKGSALSISIQSTCIKSMLVKSRCPDPVKYNYHYKKWIPLQPNHVTCPFLLIKQSTATTQYENGHTINC